MVNVDEVAGITADAGVKQKAKSGGKNWTWDSYQQSALDAMIDTQESVITEAVPGAGKCLTRGTLVLTHDGRTVPVEQVKVGDLLMGPDSKPRRVLGVTEGEGALYTVIPVKGEPWTCNEDHVLTLTGTRRFIGQTRDVSVREYVAMTASAKSCWKLWRTGVAWAEKPVPFDPYLIGLWIGDGSVGSATLTNADEEIVEFCRSLTGRYTRSVAVKRSVKNNTNTITFKNGTVDGRLLRNHLRRYLCRECVVEGEKQIPSAYVCNGARVRLEMLAGVVDADGYLSHNGYEVTSMHRRLAEQYAFLARSVGLAAYVRKKIATIKSTGFRVVYWRVSISGDVNIVPCRVKRRAATRRKQIKRATVTGFKMRRAGRGAYCGFTLSGDGRFLLGDFTVTHNSSVIVEAANQLAEAGYHVWLAAYSKRGIEELRAKAHDRVNAKTVHAVGRARLLQGFPRMRRMVDAAKLERHVLAAVNSKKMKMDSGDLSGLAALVSLAKAKLAKDAKAVIDIMRDDAPWKILAMNGHQAVADLVIDVLMRCATDESCFDFDDMVWMPHVRGLANNNMQSEFDIVIADELNDQSIVRTGILLNFGDRFIGAGDANQRIFAFAGAERGIINMIADREKSVRKPLSVTYRCSQLVVQEANQYFEGIYAAPQNPKGSVSWVPDLRKVPLDSKTIVLGRTNASIIEAALILLDKGREGTFWLDLSPQGRSRLEAFADKKTSQAAMANAPIPLVVAYERLFSYAGRTHSAYRELLKKLCMPNDSVARVCSIHQSKGQQAHRVAVLWSSFDEVFDDGTPSAEEDARSLKYVAITRAEQELIYV